MSAAPYPHTVCELNARVIKRALLWIMHRANIARLVNGTEGKIGAYSGA
jgi:glycerol-3-phosphate acyltransferase PlsY